jgi:hypothetical protein
MTFMAVVCITAGGKGTCVPALIRSFTMWTSSWGDGKNLWVGWYARVPMPLFRLECKEHIQADPSVDFGSPVLHS